MGYFGISSSDCLRSVLLVETAMWGKVFLEGNLPLFLYALLSHHYESVFTFVNLLFVGISLTKFAAQGILAFALLEKYYSSRDGFVKAWYWIGIVSDLILIMTILILRLIHPRYNPILDTLIVLVQFVLLRGGIWIFTTKLIADNSAEDNPLTRSRMRYTITISTCLAWEVVWYLLVTVSLFVANYFGPRLALVVIPVGFPWTMILWYGATVLGALFLWVAIIQKLRVFLMLWLPVYFVVNLIGYALLIHLEVLNDYTLENYSDNSPTYHAFQGIKIATSLCAFGIKIGVLVCSTLLLINPESETTNDGAEHKEIQPLITSEK